MDLWSFILSLTAPGICYHYILIYYLRKSSVYILLNISIWVPWRKAIQEFAYIKVCIQVSIFECGRVHYHYWHYDCSLSICCTCFGFSEPWRLNRETKHTDTVFQISFPPIPASGLDWWYPCRPSSALRHRITEFALKQRVRRAL